MKKHIRIVWLGITLLFLLTTTASAESISAKNFDTVFNEEEYQQVLSTIQSTSDFEELNSITSTDVQSAYKTFNLSGSDFVQIGDKQPYEIIAHAEQIFWVVQTQDHLIDIKKDTPWKVIGYWKLAGADENEDRLILNEVVQLDNIVSILENSNKLSHPISDADAQMVILYVPACEISFLYYQNKNDRYMIPYHARPDVIPLNSETVYTVEEVTQVINDYFAELETAYNPLSAGGNGLQETTTSHNVQWLFIPFLVGLCLLAGIIIFLITRKKKLKN